MKRILLIVVYFCGCFSTMWGGVGSSLLPNIENSKQKIVLQNRILVTLNDRTISLLDVVKRMDVTMSRYYPEESKSTIHRFQFYLSQWRNTLSRMVDEELMLMDAISRGVAVSDGDVREELQNRFGPNVVASLETLGLSYEEARQLIHQEMVVQRIYWIRVQAKSMQKVTPQALKLLYGQYLKENPIKEELEYQVLTVLAKDIQQMKQATDKIIDLKNQTASNLLESFHLLKEEKLLEEDVSITVSQDLSSDVRNLSLPYLEVLQKLDENQWSEAIAFPLSGSDNKKSFRARIFHLKKRKITHPSPFCFVEKQLKDAIFDQTASREGEKYVKQLRTRFDFKDSLINASDSFHPFAIS